MYNIELLVNTKEFKKGTLIRGWCKNTNDFSKFKRWFADLYLNDDGMFSLAQDTNSVKQFFKKCFKIVNT